MERYASLCVLLLSHSSPPPLPLPSTQLKVNGKHNRSKIETSAFIDMLYVVTLLLECVYMHDNGVLVLCGWPMSLEATVGHHGVLEALKGIH